MLRLSIQELATATKARILNCEMPELVYVSDLSNDTRTLGEGSGYIALVGENFDGHAFTEQAITAGAGCLIVSDSQCAKGHSTPTLVVEDTLYAMGEVARMVRALDQKRQWVGVCGSNGKTTTREMIAALIDSKGRVLKNDGNLNNRIGVPQTLFRLGREHVNAVVELGTSEPGEIQRLTEIVQPTIGVMTNIAEEHLEGLGSIEGVFEEESQLFRGMSEDSIAIINYDDPWSIKAQHFAKGKVVSFGFDRRATIRASEVIVTPQGTTFRVNERHAFTLNMVGRHNVSNALAAIAVGWVMGVEIEKMQAALAAFKPVSMRSDFERVGRFNLINDCYNANPGSMRAAIQTLNDFRAKKRRIAVIGDMLELGDAAVDAHWQIGWWLRTRQVDWVVCVGPMMEVVAAQTKEVGIKTTICATSEDAAQIVAKKIKAEDTILVKGSRGMRMEKVSQAIRERVSSKKVSRAFSFLA